MDYEPRFNPLNAWRTRIARARYELEVVAVVNDYLATWTPGDIMRLPVEIRPRRMRDAEDVQVFLFDLMQHRCAPGSDAEAAARRLVAVLSSASDRLSRLLQCQRQPGDGNYASGNSASA